MKAYGHPEHGFDCSSYHGPSWFIQDPSTNETFQKSWHLLKTPNTRALLIRTQTQKRTPNLQDKAYRISSKPTLYQPNLFKGALEFPLKDPSIHRHSHIGHPPPWVKSPASLAKGRPSARRLKQMGFSQNCSTGLPTGLEFETVVL